MPITQRPERKSIHTSFTDGKNEIIALSASYSGRNISISIDMFDEAYCANNKDEVENAIKGFLTTVRGVLSEANLPSI